jgi:hypothetical protein
VLCESEEGKEFLWRPKSLPAGDQFRVVVLRSIEHMLSQCLGIFWKWEPGRVSEGEKAAQQMSLCSDLIGCGLRREVNEPSQRSVDAEG